MLNETTDRICSQFVTLFVYHIVQLYEYIFFLCENNLLFNKFSFSLKCGLLAVLEVVLCGPWVEKFPYLLCLLSNTT